jgi:hypothetical protein
LANPWEASIAVSRGNTLDRFLMVEILQPSGSLAKAYQVKQVRNVIVHDKLAEKKVAQ